MLKIFISKMKKNGFLYKGVIVVSILWNCILIVGFIISNPPGIDFWGYSGAGNISSIVGKIIYYIGVNIILGPAVLFWFLLMIIGWISEIFRKN